MRTLIFSILFLTFTKVYSQDYYAIVLLKNKLENHAYINNKGEITYEEAAKDGERIYPLSDGLGVIKRKGKHGYIDPLGKIVIPIEYDAAEPFSEGLAAVKIHGKWGYINKKNEMVIKPTLKSNIEFNNKRSYSIDETIMQNNLYKVIDTLGNSVSDKYYLNINKFTDNCSWVKDKDAKDWGCINTNGEYIVQPKYNRVTYFKNGRCWVQIDSKWGYINKKGEYLVEPIYEDTNNELNGYTWVQKQGTWGLLDSTGKVVIPLTYKNTPLYGLKSAFSYVKFATPSNGLIAFNSGSKSGYYDLSFKQVIAPTFDEVTNFIDGVAAVKLNNKWGFIDTTGKLICDYKFHNIKYLDHGLYCSEENNNIVVFDKTGNIIADKFLKVSKFK